MPLQFKFDLILQLLFTISLFTLSERTDTFLQRKEEYYSLADSLLRNTHIVPQAEKIRRQR